MSVHLKILKLQPELFMTVVEIQFNKFMFIKALLSELESFV